MLYSAFAQRVPKQRIYLHISASPIKDCMLPQVFFIDKVRPLFYYQIYF